MAATLRPAHRADLEVLRGAAVLLVVLYHAGVRGFGGAFVAVDVLFVVSGFLATRHLAREWAATGGVGVAAFWARRARRLLPALVVMLAATLAAAWLLLAPMDRAPVAAAARAAALGVANHAFAARAVDYFSGAESPFLHTWTLGVELQAALLWPLLFVALAALGTRGAAARGIPAGAAGESARRADGLARGVAPGLLLLALGSLAVGAWLTWTAPSWAYFGTPARLAAIAVGGLVALAVGADRPTPVPGSRLHAGLVVAGLLALAAALLGFDRATPYPGLATLVPVLGTAAIVAGGARGGGPLAGTGAPLGALRALGRVSYGWYLWHWPVAMLAAALVPDAGVATRLAWMLAALLPAWLTARWIERPAHAAGEAAPDAAATTMGDASTPRAAWRAHAWTAAAVAGCAGVVLGAGVMERASARALATPAQRALAAARRDRMPHRCWAGPGVATPPRDGTCVFGDPRGATTVALFGDSHAEHWLGALDRLGRERGWRVVLLVKGGCPVAAAPELEARDATTRRQAGRMAECARWREAAVRRLVALRPAAAVLSSYDAYVARDAGWWSGAWDGEAAGRHVTADAWGRGLHRTYGRLAAAGIPVVALRGTPSPGFDVPACLARRAGEQMLASDCRYDLDGALHPTARAAQAAVVRDLAARGLPVRAVDLGDVVCGGAPCGVVRWGRVVFTDDNHLTASFSRAAAGALGARLDAALAPLGARLP